MKLKNKNIRNFVLTVLVAVFAVFVLVKSYIPESYDVGVGDICPSDVFANAEIVDEVTTAALKKQAMDLVKPGYAVITGAKSESMAKSDKIYAALRAEESVEEYKNLELDESFGVMISDLSQEDYERLVSGTRKAIETVMTQNVTTDNYELMKKELLTQLESVGISDDYIAAAHAIASYCLSVNVEIDYDAYDKAKQDSAASVEPVVYKKGAKVIGRGEVIEEKHYMMMKKMGNIEDSSIFNFAGHLGRAIIVVIMIVLVSVYFFTRQKKFYDRYYPAYCSIVAIELLIILLFVLNSTGISYYIAPVLMTAMLLALLFGSKIALVTNVMICILTVLALDCGPGMLITGLISGSFVSVMLSRLKSRSGILKISAMCAVLSGVLTIAYDAGVHESLLLAAKNGALSAIGVIIACILSIGLVPVSELLFGILTPFRLSEYTNFESPLLKKLIIEAPGTYHHCLMVGNLAENAANEIGANALLTRAGAYYHDVGKLKRPQMFKENQYSDNPHDALSPWQSANYILSHTHDGLEFAKKYKLPKELADFIDQHHGTTLAAYFYHQAKEENPDANPEDFRYKGLKPQTKETAIIMLADTVEAAMRSMSEYTYDEMESFVDKLMKTKINDGQLSECDITLHDIERIKKSFLYTLKGYFHQRIKYPGQDDSKDNKEA